MGYVVEFLVLGVIAAVIFLVVHASRSNPARAVLGPGRQRLLDGCCLEVPCSAECARRQQAAYTARYAQGAEDALRYPDAIRGLVLTAAQDYQIGQGGRTALPADRTAGSS